MGSNNNTTENLQVKWELVTLNDVCAKITDGSHFSPKNIEQGYPYVTVRDIDDNGNIDLINCKKISQVSYNELLKGDCKPFEGDVLFSKDGTVGKVALVNFEKEFVILSSLAILRPDPNRIKSEFLYWLMRSPSIQEDAIGLKTGAAIKRVVLKTIKQIKISVPPLPEQNRISLKVSNISSLLDNAIKLIEENIEHTKHLVPSALNEIFTDPKYKEDLLTVVCEFNPQKSEVKNDRELQVSFLPMADLNAKQMFFEAKQEKLLSEVYTGYTYFKDKDVLLAKVTPCFENGKSGIAINLKNGIGFGSSEYYVFRAGEKILPEWIYYNISSNGFLKEGAGNMSGAVGLKRVTKDFINSWKIKLPDIKTQRKIIDHLNHLSEKQQALQQQYTAKLKHLKALKASILSSAFKGEL